MKKLFALIALLLTSQVYAQAIPDRIKATILTRGTTDPTVAEASDFTAVADTSGSLSAKSFRFYNPAGVCYQPWYNVDSGSTAPTASTGCTLVEVAIASNDTNSTVAGNTRTVLNAAPYTNYFTITGSTTHIIVTSKTKGSATDGNIGDSGFSVSKTQGVSSTALISSSAIVGNVVMWKVCNDAVQTSTQLFLGKAVDTETDGTSLDKGACFTCASCRGDTLRDLKVSGQAASNTYTVIQYQKQ